MHIQNEKSYYFRLLFSFYKLREELSFAKEQLNYYNMEISVIARIKLTTYFGRLKFR